MLSNTTINTLFLDLVPVLAALSAWFYQWATQRLPANQRTSLEQFSRIATGKIEQVFPNAGSANKKQLATELVVDLFNAFHLPTPDSRAIDAAIESAVLAINQAQTVGDGLAPASANLVSASEQVAK